ncbi:MAG: glycogen debranching protein [Spirochaetia bacterium]|jgi:hypothetical protein|nr:glycogen debranching protein [Spirochaetia bacterium]
MNRKKFFSLLPDMSAYFGNLLTVEQAEKETSLGISHGYWASLMQFQPLFEVAIYKGKLPVAMELVERSSSPIEEIKKYTGNGLTYVQKIAVIDDRVLLDISLAASSDLPREDLQLGISGACLFSPEGIPYHWLEEAFVHAAVPDTSHIEGVWEDESFVLSLSQPAEHIGLRPVLETEVERQQYFSSFNLKKRFRYWVALEARKENNCLLSTLAARNFAYHMTMIPNFEKNGEAHFSVELSIHTSKDRQSHSCCYGEVSRELENRWDHLVEELPVFSCVDTDLERIYATSWYVLHSSRISCTRKHLPYPFTSVNKFHYFNQFFWDSAFENIALLWYNKPGPAEDEMKNFVKNQWRCGMLPYELFMYPTNGREWMDGDFHTSGTTQPPVIGISLWQVYCKYGHKDYLQYFYDSLVAYERWLGVYRDLGKRGLSCYVNIWESGWDNSPRFDAVTRNRVLDPYVESVDFNVYVYILRGTILRIAKLLGKTEPEGIRTRMEKEKQSMNAVMYCPEDGFYYDVIAGTSEQIKVRTAAGLLPLLTDIPTKAQKDCLINDYLLSDKEFLSEVPVPSVSRIEKCYDPKDFWRGANWPQITWSLIYGISEEYPREAGILLDRFLQHTVQNQNCYEYYHSETGEGAGLPFQGWGSLYIDLIIRFVAGISPCEHGFCFNPVSQEYTDFSLSNIRLKECAVSVKRSGRHWCISLSSLGTIQFDEPDLVFHVEKQSDSFVFTFSKKPDSLEISFPHSWKDGLVVYSK